MTAVEDEKGNRWCDPMNENHCHRCGRIGHIAARCVYDMPDDIKSWVLDRPGTKPEKTFNVELGNNAYIPEGGYGSETSNFILGITHDPSNETLPEFSA